MKLIFTSTGDYLDVLKVLKDTSYFYFTLNKSSIIELCDWIETNLAASNPFKDAVKTEMQTNVNYVARYTDIMLHKKYVVTTTGVNTDYKITVS